MKIMVIGNIGFDLMAPYLRHKRISSVLVSIAGGDFHTRLADKAYSLHACDDWRPLVEIALHENVDAVISIAGPDHVNLRDARVKEVLERDFGLPVLANPLPAVTVAADKLKTKTWLRERDFPVTPGAPAFSASEAKDIAGEFGYPVVLKLLDHSGGVGMKVAESARQISPGFFADNVPILVEKYIEGPEFSVEVLNYSGRSLPLLPVYKGATSRDGLHPMERVKLAPAPLNPVDIARLRRLARRIVTELDLQPTADVDIVWGADGPQVMEINPRFGGVTALSMAASGVPVYWALVDMVLGDWDPGRYRFDRAVAADLPISADITGSTVAELLDTEGIFRVKLQKLKKTAGRVALRADDSRQLLRSARQAASLCGRDYDCYQELKELLSNK